MNVVIGCPKTDGQTGVYLCEAFEELGHTVSACINARTEGPQAMLDAVDQHKPMFVLLTKDPAYKPILEELAAKTFVVVWSFDPRTELAISPEFKHCQLLYTNEADYLTRYIEFGIKNARWLSEGISPIWHRREKVTTEDLFNFSAEVAFAGCVTGIHQGRTDLLNEVRKSFPHLQIYSDVINRAHNKMVQCTSVNLGHSGWPHISLSMSARDYRIMGAGGFLLTNHVTDIETWFEVGKMCDTYQTPGECVEKIKYYLEHDDKRMEMADYAYEVVHAKHKFSDRIKVMISDVEALI